jgi:sialate O-acetylesterase
VWRLQRLLSRWPLSQLQHFNRLLPAMIADWRMQFAQGNFPFYVVSLPAFKARFAAPGDDEWAENL